MKCSLGNCTENAAVKRPKTGEVVCKKCFFWVFETEVHLTIILANLFKRGEMVAIGASGGKDSTVLAHVLKVLNEKYDYGLKLVLLSVDEGITGYRDDSLETVKRNKVQYQLPLKIVSYDELYGWSMDAVVEKVGRKNNCTFCGVFRRQALDRGAESLGVDKIVTGHNADDMAETVIMNILRGDVARLKRCMDITTGSEGSIPRCKPLKYMYEKEIVMYAHFKKLDYFSTECTYSPNAFRGYARAYLKDLEKIRPRAILDIIHVGETLSVKECIKLPSQGTCCRCGYISSQKICKACVLLEGLNKNIPNLGIGKSNKVDLDALEADTKNGNTGRIDSKCCTPNSNLPVELCPNSSTMLDSSHSCRSGRHQNFLCPDTECGRSDKVVNGSPGPSMACHQGSACCNTRPIPLTKEFCSVAAAEFDDSSFCRSDCDSIDADSLSCAFQDGSDTSTNIT